MAKKQKLYCPFCGTSVDELSKVISDMKYKLNTVRIDYCPCGYTQKVAVPKNRVIGVGYDEIKEIFGKDIMGWVWAEIASADLSKKVKFIYLYSEFSKRNEFRIFIDKRVMFKYYVENWGDEKLTSVQIRKLIKRKSKIVEVLSDSIVAVLNSAPSRRKSIVGCTFHLK